MRIGITGASGFIGRLLSDRLARAGHELVLVDLVAHPTLPTITRDFWDPDSLKALASTEVVLHLAALSGIVACEKDPKLARLTNIVGLAKLVDELERSPVRLLFASTFAVLGAPKVQPITEEAPLAPINEYGRHKVAGEMLVRSLGVRGGVARMSNVYGSYKLGSEKFRKGNVLTLFVQQATTGALRVHEPGDQARDFVHVEDVVRFWQAAAERSGRAPAPPPVLHFASGERWTVRALAEEVQRTAPNHPRIEVVPNPRVESLEPEFAIDTSRTRAWLGLAPTHSVRQTLHEEIERGPER